MSVEMIGKRIAALRKAMGRKQEELAAYVGVSAQAVSKWENGGLPDVELLPKIADFFSIPIDTLYGRNQMDYSGIQAELGRKMLETPMEERFKVALNYCWDMERGMCGYMPEGGSVEEYEQTLAGNDQQYSSVISDYGFTRMGIANRLQYFLLVSEIQNVEEALFEGVDYAGFFRDFSDKDVFDACVFLHRRKSEKPFTEKILMKHLHVEEEKAKQILRILEKYNLLEKTETEIDDEKEESWCFVPTPSFVAFLIFTREMVATPNGFCYYHDSRNKPYL